MYRRLPAALLATPLALASGGAWPITTDDKHRDDSLSANPCVRNLEVLISHMHEQAEREGVVMHVERNVDGSVLLHYGDLFQRMRCQQGVLVVDFPGFTLQP